MHPKIALAYKDNELTKGSRIKNTNGQKEIKSGNLKTPKIVCF